MRILITGICGFVGSTLAHVWVESGVGHALHGIDNLIRPGSETNRLALRGLGVTVIEYSAAALTLSVAPPLTAPLVAVTVYVPALVGAQVALLAQPASALLALQVGVMVTALPY